MKNVSQIKTLTHIKHGQDKQIACYRIALSNENIFELQLMQPKTPFHTDVTFTVIKIKL